GPPNAEYGNGCNEDLWRSDGTSAGTFKLRELDLPQWGSHRVYEMDEQAFFVGSDPEHSRELWKSDGTPEGTTMIEDVNPGTGPSQVSAVRHSHYSTDPVLDDRFYFDADNGTHGSEVWISDGTEDGTQLMADIRPGDKGSHPHNFQATESLGLVFFIADDGRHGYELWKTDGAAGGTRMLKDINPDGNGVGYEAFGGELTRLGDKLYFFATDGDHPFELWATDGTRRGTKRVADL
ncbi:MAG TPA: ELWxxDGT repeat protein, partial [Actinomycetota bacterium]